jgi:hypothetical protein
VITIAICHADLADFGAACPGDGFGADTVVDDGVVIPDDVIIDDCGIAVEFVHGAARCAVVPGARGIEVVHWDEAVAG